MKQRNAELYEVEKLLQYGIKNIKLIDPKLVEFEAGEPILYDGKESDELYFLLSGKVRLFLNASEDQKLKIIEFSDYGVVDEVRLFTGTNTAPVNAYAKTAVSAVMVKLSANRDLLLNDPEFVKENGTQTAKLLDLIVNRFYNKMFPKERLLCSYIAATRTEAVWKFDAKSVKQDLNLEERQTERILDSLCAKGILAKEGEGWRIADVGRFESYNNGEYIPKNNKKRRFEF